MNLQTVTGLIPMEALGLMDGHGHVWIQPPEGAQTRLHLNDYPAICGDLKAFHAAGGSAIVDCQPGGAGRDARKLQQISMETGIFITATTGFHQQQYYPPGHALWSMSADEAAQKFIGELTQGMEESPELPATCIKVGYEGHIQGQSAILMEAAAIAARETGVAILFHTERGVNVEALIPFFERHGVPPTQLYLCHVDKRPDFGLHRELAEAGVLLGYDTFARPKYHPDENVWPLLEAMITAGLETQIAVGLDLALQEMWRFKGDPFGQEFLSAKILHRMQTAAYAPEVIKGLTGHNVARFLIRRNQP